MTLLFFPSPTYLEARPARLRNLFAHIDPATLAGNRILELGSGTGELGQAFVELGCSVVSVDARREHIMQLRMQYPEREARIADLEHWDFSSLGYFDAILCFSLLYHLARPADLLARCARSTKTVFLETMVLDSAEAVVEICEEDGADQAFSGRGCRPSPAWIVAQMASLGFSAEDISGSLANWGGEHASVFDWPPMYRGEWRRQIGFLRKMFICRRVEP
jgi:SAM-dependent methyltransferase